MLTTHPTLPRFGIVLEDAKILKSAVPTLQFKVAVYEQLEEDAKRVLFEIPGWRVSGGKVVPPCRRTPQGAFVANVTTRHAAWADLLDRMLIEWKDSFPAVQFPSNLPAKLDVRNIGGSNSDTEEVFV